MQSAPRGSWPTGEGVGGRELRPRLAEDWTVAQWRVSGSCQACNKLRPRLGSALLCARARSPRDSIGDEPVAWPEGHVGAATLFNFCIPSPAIFPLHGKLFQWDPGC
jgi:hypothetical protein